MILRLCKLRADLAQRGERLVAAGPTTVVDVAVSVSMFCIEEPPVFNGQLPPSESSSMKYSLNVEQGDCEKRSLPLSSGRLLVLVPARGHSPSVSM